MNPLKQIDPGILAQIDTVMADIDDTLTLNGRIPAVAFSAMERLQAAGIRVIPITGRPAGWCDHIARMWPVDGIVGENGAFYFYYRREDHKMVRRYWETESVRHRHRERLSVLAQEILAAVPGSGIAADQAYRETDLAIDFREDVAPLSLAEAEKIVQLFVTAGARAKISSIHVNGWFGDYDKLAMTRILSEEIFDRDLEKHRERIVFVGDSPNDVPMFKYFPQSVGVANIREFGDQISTAPAWVTERPGGYGFAELADIILHGKKVSPDRENSI
jgi:HAD superfamily hydrolase (TIGR01484 family)